jgi:folate-binding protein YgfZ
MTETTSTPALWQAFLTSQGAIFSPDDATDGAEVRQFDSAAGTAATDNFVAPLSDLGLISLSGEDAASFLHNQITNDVEKLDLNSARLAGYCTPKGRLLATFLMWKDSQQIVLQLPRTLQAAIQKRLQMFVLRAKVKLNDDSSQRVALGLAGPLAAEALQSWFAEVPAQAYAKTDNQYGTLIRLADSRQLPRYQWITTAEQAIAAWPLLTRTLTPAATQIWRLSDIHAGVPVITTATQEQFVPQMINFELIGGVNFKKGCYPGQEIVARSQYLGKLKRRSVLALVDDASVQAGSEVFSSEDPGQPCGMVVNAEAADTNTAACLIEIKLAALESGSIHVGAITGPALKLLDLPYALAEPQ